jgi:hypothetical protein
LTETGPQAFVARRAWPIAEQHAALGGSALETQGKSIRAMAAVVAVPKSQVQRTLVNPAVARAVYRVSCRVVAQPHEARRL